MIQKTRQGRNDRPTQGRNDRPTTDSAFAALGLSRSLCDAVSAAGYETPTPIQIEAIPDVLRGRDLLGCAQTGTGKTAAFALPILHHLAGRRGKLRVLVLAPVRELAAQIGASFAKYGRRTGLRHLVIFGGVNKGPQKKALREGIHFSKPTGPSGKKVYFRSAIQSWIKQRDVILKADYARKNFRRSLVP